MGNRRERLRIKMYEASLAMSGMTPAEIKDNLKDSKAWKNAASFVKEQKSQMPLFLKIFIPLLIVFQAFFPSFITWEITLPFLALLIVGVILVVLAAYFTGGAVLSFLNIMLDVLVPIAIIAILSLLVQSFGSPEYFQVLSIKYGTFAASAALLILTVLGLILVKIKSPLAFIFASCFFGVFLFLILPLALGSSATYKLCSQIPFLSSVCPSREVRIDELKTVKIPVSGGIDLKFGTEQTNWQPAGTLYAGEPYEFSFTLTNYYEEPISFDLEPMMLSEYGSKLKFIQSFNERKNSLQPKESYPDSAFMNPEEMKVEEVSGCPYTLLQINVTKKIPIEQIPCAYDKPCEDEKMACVKTGNFECDCVDWATATCSKSSVEAEVQVKHSGFFRGSAKLYYSESSTSAAPGFELSQGPLSVVIELQPNPYIASIHQYRKDVSIFVTFKNKGGDMTIKSFKVEPQNTVVHTIDRQKGVELIEEVGAQIINCRSITELLPDGFLPSGAEISGKLCTITPPFVKTTLEELKNNQILETNGVTYDKMSDYCNKVKPETTEESTTTSSWSINWDKIYDSVKESGTCEVLNRENKEDNEKQTIENSLAFTEIVVDFQYERTALFKSDSITPYTRTEECMKLAEANKQ
jgi:hypothetical protein